MHWSRIVFDFFVVTGTNAFFGRPMALKRTEQIQVHGFNGHEDCSLLGLKILTGCHQFNRLEVS